MISSSITGPARRARVLPTGVVDDILVFADSLALSPSFFCFWHVAIFCHASLLYARTVYIYPYICPSLNEEAGTHNAGGRPVSHVRHCRTDVCSGAALPHLGTSEAARLRFPNGSLLRLLTTTDFSSGAWSVLYTPDCYCWPSLASRHEGSNAVEE
jgi:hypothetical protein